MNNWPLTKDNFSYWDRLKMSFFLLNKKNIWTRGKQTELLEQEVCDFFNLNINPLFVSSGSTANTLIAMYWKDRFWSPEKNKIIFPATTWSTSVSPFVREGFKPIFVDIDKKNFFAKTSEIADVLSNRTDICGMFLTTVLGFTPNISKITYLKRLCKEKGIKIAFDHCESSLSDGVFEWGLSTTSSYFSHFLQSVEGGFVFPENQEQRNYFLSAMNHGMTRWREDSRKIQNLDVNTDFDFYSLGNNFRNSDLNAFLCRISLTKQNKERKTRRELFNTFLIEASKLNSCPIDLTYNCEDRVGDTPFAIPIVFNSSVRKKMVKNLSLETNGIQSRPIISGNLLRQTAFKKYNQKRSFPVADRLHDNGLYIGLHTGITKKQIKELVEDIL